MSRFIIFYFIFVLFLALGCQDDCKNPAGPTNPVDMPYNVTIDPSDFLSDNIDGNTYFPLTAGRTLVYSGEDEKGKEVRIEEKFTSDTKMILGVKCVVVEFREWVGGDLVEVTYDWYAEDKQGNVWYFGEDVEDYENGVLVSTAGAWEAGVDGALSGILMPAQPYIGFWFRQEYYANEAEDVAQILETDITVTVPAGTYANCLKTAEWSPLEPGIVENKYWAPGIGNIKVEKVEGDVGFEELTEIID